MPNKLKSMLYLFLFLSSVSTGLASPPQTLVRVCNQSASQEQAKYEKELVVSTNENITRYMNRKKKYEVGDLITPEQKMDQIKMFSLVCEASFNASSDGLEKDTFRDYLLNEIYTKGDLDEVHYWWFKPIFIRMIDYGYTLSDQQ